MNTIHKNEIPAIGTAIAGGFLAGMINVHGQQFALIASGKEGDHDDTPWNKSLDQIEDASSYFDGFENTKAMAEHGSTVARWAQSLELGGYQDWYIPSRDELEILYRNLKPTDYPNYCSFRDGDNASSLPAGYPYTKSIPAQTGVEAFQSDCEHAFEPAWYWSSTQFASYSGYAWIQVFDDGSQYYDRKDYEGRVRAVRRLLVIQ